MDADLEPIYLRLTQANQPEDVFRFDDVILPPSLWRELLTRQYETLKVTTTQAFSHPEDRSCAEEADRLLESFYSRALDSVESQQFALPGWNKPKPHHFDRTFKIGTQSYWVGVKTAENALFSFYPAVLETNGRLRGLVRIKRANTSEASVLLANEARILNQLHSREVPQWKHLPQLLDKFQSEGLFGIVLRQTHGTTLADVRHHRKHLNGLDQKHMVWMIDRCLSVLGFIHRQGVVHGSISPEKLLIQPDYHNVLITDWVGSVLNPALSFERVRNCATPEAFVAPEVVQNGRVGPWSDLYSLGKSMIWALGGDPVSNAIPDSLEEPLKFTLLRLVAPELELRPSDAWEVFREVCEIKDSLWPRKFLPLDLS